MASVQMLPEGMTMDNTYGAALLGTFFGLIMYGILIHQTLHYFSVYSSDSTWMKSYVLFIVMLDTTHSVVIMTLCYLKLVTHYSSSSYLAVMNWPLSILTIITAANVVACQSFFAYRVYQIGRKSRLVVWLCMACQGAGFGLCVAITVKVFQAEVWQTAIKYAPWISVTLGIAVFVDTILAAVLVVWLRRSRTGLKSTNSLLDTLIAYAVTTGLLTDLFNILGFIFALATSQNLYYAAMNMLVTKVYTNSVMAALNFRRRRGWVESQYLGTITELRVRHSSLFGPPRPSQAARRSKVPYEVSMEFIPQFSGDVINITADNKGTHTPSDLETGNRIGLQSTST